MSAKPLISSMQLKNFLSFGPDSEVIQLESLNLLIGANASGKSNFIKAFDILRHLPEDKPLPDSVGGGFNEWLWKGDNSPVRAQINVVANEYQTPYRIDYKLELSGISRNKFTVTELIGKNGSIIDEKIPVGQDRSILAQRKDPERYPTFKYLSDLYSEIMLYRDRNFGPNSPVRKPQYADFHSNILFEDAVNLSIVLRNLKENSPTEYQTIFIRLQTFYEHLDRLTIDEDPSGYLHLLFHEKGLREPVRSKHISSGTLWYLSLLTILCHPMPPSIICIEEPEIGLHPDMIGSLAELLIEASKHTQIFITTHSDTLISEFSEHPEYVMVCEKMKDGTQIKRLEKDRLREWLEDYSLGELWMKGELGGTRW